MTCREGTGVLVETSRAPVANASYAVCKPNFSGPGRVRRQRIGWVLAVVSVATLVALIVMHAAWSVRLLVSLPVMASAVSLLQVSRNTCIANAATGVFEHDDFSKTKVAEEDAAASRRVARTIYRDSLLLGIAAGLLAAASAFV